MDFSLVPIPRIKEFISSNTSPCTESSDNEVPFITSTDLFFSLEHVRKSGGALDICRMLAERKCMLLIDDEKGDLVLADLDDSSIVAAMTDEDTLLDILENEGHRDPLLLSRNIIIQYFESTFAFSIGEFV